MGSQFSSITQPIQNFIEQQICFFVGTSREEGSVNISPKGMDSLRIIDENTVIWFNLTGSGNETAAHLMKNKRMTLMFCSFDETPLIIRLYGHAEYYSIGEEEYERYADLFDPFAGGRQIIKMKVNKVATACGWGVPIMKLVKVRDNHQEWAKEKGVDGMEEYRKAKNAKSIDGFDIVP